MPPILIIHCQCPMAVRFGPKIVVSLLVTHMNAPMRMPKNILMIEKVGIVSG